MPLWASWLKDFDSLNIFHDELKIEKMAKFEILIATNGLIGQTVILVVLSARKSSILLDTPLSKGQHSLCREE